MYSFSSGVLFNSQNVARLEIGGLCLTVTNKEMYNLGLLSFNLYTQSINIYLLQP